MALGDAVIAGEPIREDVGVALEAEDQSKTLVTTKYKKELIYHRAGLLNPKPQNMHGTAGYTLLVQLLRPVILLPGPGNYYWDQNYNYQDEYYSWDKYYHKDQCYLREQYYLKHQH